MCLVNPATVDALLQGHPEELLTASLCVGAVLAAGPRASMWLLTLLPLAGPGVVVVLGLPVTEVYGTGGAGAAGLLGLGLTASGWLWSRRLLSRALRPAVVT